MNKLTIEQIKFIDSYLYNAGVHYIDIRCEMTDHAATAIENMEGDFGQNFYAFMASNKRELLASNKSFKRKAMSKAWGLLLGNFTRPFFLVTTAILLLLAFGMEKSVGYDDVSGAFMILHLVTYVCLYFCWIYFWTFKSNRYSVIDRLLVISFFLPMLFRFESSIENKTIMLIFYSLYTALIITLLFTVQQFYKKYKVSYGS